MSAERVDCFNISLDLPSVEYQDRDQNHDQRIDNGVDDILAHVFGHALDNNIRVKQLVLYIKVAKVRNQEVYRTE
jgi:hypothetical protein